MNKIITVALLVIPSTIFAHPGHGTTEGYTITHYFTEAQHVIISVSVMLISAFIIRKIRNRKKQQA